MSDNILVHFMNFIFQSDIQKQLEVCLFFYQSAHLIPPRATSLLLFLFFFRLLVGQRVLIFGVYIATSWCVRRMQFNTNVRVDKAQTWLMLARQ